MVTPNQPVGLARHATAPVVRLSSDNRVIQTDDSDVAVEPRTRQRAQAAAR